MLFGKEPLYKIHIFSMYRNLTPSGQMVIFEMYLKFLGFEQTTICGILHNF